MLVGTEVNLEFPKHMEPSPITIEDALTYATLPVPVAGRVFFGLGRNAAYEAANRGDFDTIRIGRKKVAPVAPIAARLGLPMKIGERR